MLRWDWNATASRHVDFTTPRKSKSDAMREYNKSYREKHSGYVECPCGAVFKEISKYTHVKTARHVGWMATRTTQ